MFRRVLNTTIWLLLLAALTAILLLGLATFTSQPIFAAIEQSEASPGQLFCRSEQTLKDRDGHSWQVIFFKQVYPNQVTAMTLRLMGLSGSTRILHPQPLKIITQTGKDLTAVDVFLDEAPLPSAAEYNLQEIFEQLPTEALLLELPVAGKPSVRLPVPQAVVQEWQAVASKTPSRSSKKSPAGFQLAC